MVISRHRATSVSYPLVPSKRTFISHIRYSPQSGHSSARFARPPSAMCGRLRVGKSKLHVASLVGAAMCSAC